MKPVRDADVVIIGAGPAGLVLGNLLRAADIDCRIIEQRDRQHVEQRARAGFLAANSVRILTEHGLGDGLLARGKPHRTCAFRSDGEQFELDYGALGRGEIHTVYPQQFLIADLIAEFLRRGGEIDFDTMVTAVSPGTATVDTENTRYQARYLAGCDGRHGIARAAVPARVLHRDHEVTWLALLAQAPPSMSAVGYAVHERGFAGHMARTATVTRYYLQVPRGHDPTTWSEERIWAELNLRMGAERHGPLTEGAIIERGTVDMTSYVADRIQHANLFLAGDAASLISPSAAKGANLALLEAEILATALIAAVRAGDPAALDRYSADCLPRIWRAQEFSHWMIQLLHAPADNSDHARFERELRAARLVGLRTSRAHQHHFAENYVGI